MEVLSAGKSPVKLRYRASISAVSPMRGGQRAEGATDHWESADM